MKEFDFLRPAKYFFTVSAALTLVSLVLLVVPGPRFSIEFTGGTRSEITVPAGKTQADVIAAYNAFEETSLLPTVNRLQSGNYVVRMRGIDDKTHNALLAHLKTTLGDVSEVQYTTIGPTVGRTLKVRAFYALIAASIGIIIYLAFAFRKIPRRYSPWKFGIVAVVTLLHDVMVTVGIFVILGQLTNFEADTLFVTALLTILGYSVNDTIIIFDRIRDNLFVQERKEDFATIANRSMNHVWKRSMYTSGSTLIVLFSLFFLGSESIQWFVLTLIVGILIGTYSSIFVATPLLVYWNKRQQHH
ncbi:MAG: protein translocase subunit SecF [Candidatus Peribacteraceae bacterium]|nr:protein translocase subunit SecF [Candidatus Peribacteraceae bacterium]